LQSRLEYIIAPIKMSAQIELDLEERTWGGVREGAGRKKTG
jgi:hypothetical protein